MLIMKNLTCFHKKPLQAHGIKTPQSSGLCRGIYCVFLSDGMDAGRMCRRLLMKYARINETFCSDGGSIAVEAAIVLPLFLMAMMAVFCTCRCVMTQNVVYEGFHEAAAYVAEDSYRYQGSDAVEAVSAATVGVRLRKYLDDADLVAAYVSGGTGGIRVTEARLGDDDMIYMKISYSLSIDVPLIGSVDIPCTERIRQRAYLGYSRENDPDSDGTYVYIAENESVYHSSRSCYHIKLSIRKVEERLLDNVYSALTPCEKCSGCGSDGYVYVTATGNKYHCSLECPGLKRTVYRVRKEEHEELQACSECVK